MVVASFQLTRYPRSMAPVELARLVTQRRHLRDVDGLRFSRLLGTARGRVMGLAADLNRWALFTVWDDPAALEGFLEASSVERHRRRWSDECYDVVLAPISAHGSWGGESPLAVRRAEAAEPSGPIAVLTRATLSWRTLSAFYRAVPRVDAVLDDRPGLLAAIGVGEAPVTRQATFSLWASEQELQSFAYGQRAHREVIRSTRRQSWYREEMFARLRPLRSSGTWDGHDPLEGHIRPPS